MGCTSILSVLVALVAMGLSFHRYRLSQHYLGPVSRFSFSSTAEDVTAGMDLTGKTYLVTGCNSGIGLETVRVLALRGASVVGCARTAQKATDALSAFGTTHTGLECDLSKPESVNRFVKHVLNTNTQFDAIIANAGIMALPTLQLIEGVEGQFYTNHVGHFQLVTGLLPSLKADGRVVVVSSQANWFFAPAEGIDFDNLDGSKFYNDVTAYGVSKLANVLFAQSLNTHHFAGTKQLATSVHPGVIKTNLARHSTLPEFLEPLVIPLVGLLIDPEKTIPQGAATQVYAAVHPDVAKLKLSTAYFMDSREHIVHPSATKALADRLWAESEKIVNTFTTRS